MATSSDRLDNCEVCADNKAKYTCPKCEVRTCCLTCVNVHKKELLCDGIRDKTKFVPVNNFTDLDLVNDYRLLEEIGRSVDQFQSDPLRKCTQLNTPVHLFKLRSVAYGKGIKLEFMPRNFSRHKENTTIVKWKTDNIFWRIEWIFSQAENTKWISKRAPDTIRLSDLVQSILDPVNSPEEETQNDNADTRVLLQDRLQFYRAADLTGIKVLLKAEKVKNANSRFYELDPTLSLSENFAQKTIIEYPTLYVILKDHSDMYEIVDSDEEELANEQRLRSRGRTRQRGRQQYSPVRETKRKDKTKPMNYFFDAEYTDSDENEDVQERYNDFAGDGTSLRNNISDYNELVRMEH